MKSSFPPTFDSSGLTGLSRRVLLLTSLTLIVIAGSTAVAAIP